MKNFNQIKGVFLLLLTAFIWGFSFVAQSVGIKQVDAFTFMGIRTTLGGFVLLPIILVKDFVLSKKLNHEELELKKKSDKKTIFCGIILGLVLTCASNFQQHAFYYSTGGKIAFITATYMFLVPLASLIFFKKKIPLSTWICIFSGFIGLYFLSFPDGKFSSLNKGDILAFCCAIFFCIQILLIDKFSSECDGIKLACVQFFTCGFITLILMFIFEKPKFLGIKNAILPLLYSGIMSCGVAFTLQIIGQKYCDATIGSLAMCMESVFAVIMSAIFLGEKLKAQEILGCLIMFLSIVISQVVDIIRNKNLKNKSVAQVEKKISLS